MIGRPGAWLLVLLVAGGFGWAAYERWGSLLQAVLDGWGPQQEAVTGPPAAEPPLADERVAEQPGAKGAVAEQTLAKQPGTGDAGQTELTPVARTPADPEPERAPDPERAPADTARPEQSARPAPSAPPQQSAQPEQTAQPEPSVPMVIGQVPEMPSEPSSELAAALSNDEPDEAEPPEAAVAAVDPEPAQQRPSSGAAAAPAPDSVGTGQDQPSADVTAADPGTMPEPEPAAAPATPAPPGPRAIVPSFDIVRVERDGRAVIAGRAEPGAEVEVRSGEQVIARVQASRRGEWVALPAEPLRPGDQALTVVAAREGAPAVESEQVVVVAVPAPAAARSPTDAVVRPEQPVALLLPKDESGGGRILQAPGRLDADGGLALMTVSYDESGQIQLSGEAPPGVPVRIYVDNRPAALVVSDAKGAWASGLDQPLEPGTYTLRLDQLNAAGEPVVRLETPFTRVDQPPVEGTLRVDHVVVQPGNSLWRIARRLSGRGLDYVHIYEANQGQIRDPDLIYPGQVFEVPPGFGSAG